MIESITHLSVFYHIISVNIRLILRANNKKSSKIKHYDWARLKTDTETRYI